MTEAIKRNESEQFPCSGCGAGMIFDPESQKLKCEYCGNVEEIIETDQALEEIDFDTSNELSQTAWHQENRVIHCDSCGGDSVVTAVDMSSVCVFCGSNHIIMKEEVLGLAPQGVLPFKIHKEHTVRRTKQWLGGKFYAPRELKKILKLDKLKSVYLPFFTYDAVTDTQYNAKRGDHYYVTRTRTVNGKTETYRERKTRWTSVSGKYHAVFDDWLIHASKHVNQELIHRMKSFNLEEVQPYQPEYLLGHAAERNSMSLNAGWQLARRGMEDRVKEGIRQQVGGDEFRLVGYHVDYQQPTYKHILLPVWMAHYKYKNKPYTVYINGENGRVIGDYPKSWVKILMTILSIVLIILVIYFAVTR